MIEESEQLSERLCVSYVVRITSESNPRDARLTARRSNGSALHTLDHQFSKSRAQKVRAQTAILTRWSDPSQGGLVIEDTAPLPPPPCPHPNGVLLALANGRCEIARYGAVARRSPLDDGAPRAHRPSSRRDRGRGRAAVRRGAPRATRAARARERRPAQPQRAATPPQRRRGGHAPRRKPAGLGCGDVPTTVCAGS